MTRGRWLVGIAVAAVLIAAGAAYALSTSGPFLPRTEKWAKGACTKSLLETAPTVADNEKIALCYSFLKLKEDDTTIAGLTTQLTTLEGTVASLKTATSNLEKEVTALKEEGHGGPPAPEDFVFFQETNAFEEISPVFDAKNYTHVVFTSGTCEPVDAPLRVEVSPDDSHWLTVARFKCNEPPHEAMPTAGRYYRVIDEEYFAVASIFVLGRFSD